MSKTIMRLENICKRYTVGNETVNALDNVSLKICEGDFAAITGSSGSGKSTLMNILGLLDNADSGKYILDDTDVSTLKSNWADAVRRTQIGFVFQRFCLIPTLTALENVMLPLSYCGIGSARRRELAKNALKTVGLYDRINHKPHELSGGQQQRAAVARAIVTEPKVILADEPTGNLDKASGRTVLNLLKDLQRQGRTVVLITHDCEIASAADRIIEISDGRIKPPTELYDGNNLMNYAML